MDEEHSKSLPKIRTFARDQAHVQHHDEPAVVAPVVAATAPTQPVAVIEKKPVAVPVAHITVPVKKPAVPTPASTHIPAFHELKKKSAPEMVKPASLSMPAKHVAPAQPQKKVSVKARKFEQVKTTSGGTIITDNKKGEFKVLPSILDSFKAWLKELMGSSSKAPKYTITTSDRRKGVIQKATSNNATIFTADSETLKDEIRRRQQQAAASTETDITWTPNTEVGVPLLAETTRRSVPKMPVTISFKKQASYIPPPVITEPRAVAVPPPAPVQRVFVPPPEITNFGREQNPPALPRIRITEALQNTTPVTPLVIPTAPVIAERVPQPPQEPVLPVIQIPHTPNPKTGSLKNGLRTLATFNTNLSAVIFAGSIVSLVLVVLIVRTFLGLISPTESPTDESSFVTALSDQGTTAKDLALSSKTKEALYTALASEPVPATGIREFRIVAADGTALQTQEVLELLNFKANQNLNQSVTSVRVAYTAQKRAIILEVTDPTTVFGALLAWESTMAEDLATALSTGNVPAAPFTDKTIGQTDVRILSNDGTPVLVYGFINKNVVVITQDLNAFTTLLESQP